MNKQKLFFILSILVMSACSRTETPEKETGYLVLNINKSENLKAGVEITDFILRINAGQTEILKNRIGDLPSKITLPVGLYTVEAFSMEFSEPEFEKPFYSGTANVEIEAGQTKEATLVCSQSNAGIKVVWADNFSELYNSYQARIGYDAGYLTYLSTELRTGYFLPGTVSVSILADGQTIDGGSITLAAGDMVTATLHPKENPSGSLSVNISLNETVNSREVEIIVDPEYQGGNSETDPYTVAQAINRQGENDVWIEGYIVGAKPSSGYDFITGEWQNTNIVIADSVTETDNTNAIFVELASGTSYRATLNLVDNPDHLHKKIVIKGDLTTYYSRAGLKNVAGFSFK